MGELKIHSGAVLPKHPFERATRPTRAEIDLGALAHNLRCVRRMVGDSQVCAVVKADAYGHGLVSIARELQRQGVDAFGVALAEEGFLLRRAGITRPIVVLNAVYGQAHAEVLEAGLTPVVFDLQQAEAFCQAAAGRPVGVHLKVDTGMARLGVRFTELDALLDGLQRLPALRIDGVMTHLSSADSDAEATHEQLQRFDRAVAEIRRRGYAPRVLHAANSAAAFSFPASRLDLVRTGLSLYGVPPVDVRSTPPPARPSNPPGMESGPEPSLRPVMRVRTEVTALRTLEAGMPVGYNGTFLTTRRTRVGTVPMGYGDGLPWGASNRGELLVRGRRCPIIGSVSMDLTCVDVSALEACEVGDEAVLVGGQGEAHIGARELADAARTIPYEILTGISPRVPRFYLEA